MPSFVPARFRVLLAAIVSIVAIQGVVAAPEAATDAEIFAGLIPAVHFRSRQPFPRESVDEDFFANTGTFDLRERYDALLPTFFAGLDLGQERSRLFLMLDLREDVRNWLTTYNTINLPFLGEGISPMADSNFPGVGYLALDGGKGLSASLGRRKIAWGPGTWSFAISDTVPWFDHFALAWGVHTEGSSWRYQWIVASADRAASGASWDEIDGKWLVHPAQKTMAAHRISWSNGWLRLGFGELNMIYDVSPDLQDLGPLIIYHNLYQDSNSNVLLDASVEAILGPYRLYGEYALDDYVVSLEDPKTRPTAMGWLWGAELAILPGRPVQPSKASYNAHTLREPSLYTLREQSNHTPMKPSSTGFGEGLTLRYEHYRSTAYLYRRKDAMGSYAWPERRFTVAQYADGLDVQYADSPFAYLTGFPWGPDHALDRLGVSWQDAPLAADISLAYHRQGSQRITNPYGTDYNTASWLGLTAPVEHSVRVDLDLAWEARDGFRLSLEAGTEIRPEGFEWYAGMACQVAWYW